MSSLLRFFTICSISIFVGFLIWKICLARIQADDDPQTSLEYDPGNSAALLAQNQALIKLGKLNTKQAKDIQDQARRVLLKAPLNDELFVQFALSNSLVDQKLSHYELFSLAKQRNIHNRSALLSLIVLDMEQNDFDKVVGNLDTLIKLGGKDTRLYQDTLARIATLTKGSEVIDIYLQGRPQWGRSFLSGQINKMTSYNIDNVARSLSKYSSTPQLKSEDRTLHEAFLRKLIALKAYDKAYAYWQTLTQKQGGPSDLLINDPDFKDNSLLLPFSWSIHKTPDYFSERDQNDGLYVSYADNRDRVLIEQILRLKPGQLYTLKIDAEWAYKQRQGQFYWRVLCLPSNTIAVQVHMDDDNLENGVPSINITPSLERCDAQRIQLLAKPGQYSQRIWAKIKSVTLTRTPS